jgi:hypothetical protein
MNNRLRIVGDVHAQVTPDDLVRRDARCYLDLIADVDSSIQLGDMGDAESYAQLQLHVDPASHRFFPGNHDHYNCLPRHCLGNFGAFNQGGIHGFFLRGAASSDKDQLISLGRELGRTLWFEEEELDEEQMHRAEREYLECRPEIVLSHDAPEFIARLVHVHAMRFSYTHPDACCKSSRTRHFLNRLWVWHAPRTWLFGHHHHDWQYQAGVTRFICVGELSYVDIDSTGDLLHSGR